MLQNDSPAQVPDIEKYNALLLDIGTTLLACGAHCGRINRNVLRFADALGVKAEILFSFGGLLINASLAQADSRSSSHYKRVSNYPVHFMVISEISLLSWRAKMDHYSYESIREEFDEIVQISPFERWKVLLGVGFSSAALCIVAKGDWRNAITAFIASVSGMFVRQEMTRRKFNGMMAVVAAALVTALIASLDAKFKLGNSPEATLATSVLYLVPGVHLVNTVIDVIEGHFSTAVARGLYAAFILLCIAVGMWLSIVFIGVQNF